MEDAATDIFIVLQEMRSLKQKKTMTDGITSSVKSEVDRTGK